MNKYTLLIVFVFFALACKKNTTKPDSQTVKTTQNKKKTNTISILYYNYVFDNKPVSWETIELDSNKGDAHVLIEMLTDKHLLAKLDSLIATLEPEDSYEVADIRIAALIKYDNGSCDSLCIGDVYANRIYLNGKLQKTNNLLLFILKNNIGYYPWMIGDAMMNMTELKDTSFAKEPFKSSPAYEAYQQRLRNE